MDSAVLAERGGAAGLGDVFLSVEAVQADRGIMVGLGIAQEGDEILCVVARPFDLPVEAEDARRVIAELNSAAERVAKAHVFGKGMGIAAPQIGISRAAAIVRTPNVDTITLFNPRIVETGGGEDEQ